MSSVAVPLLDRRVRWGLVAIAYASLLVVPSGGPSPLGPWLDEGLHASTYMAFAFLVAYAMAGASTGRTRLFDAGPTTGRIQRAATVLAVAVGYGLAIELAQAQVVYRQFAPSDLVANGVGALVGTAWFACERWIQYNP